MLNSHQFYIDGTWVNPQNPQFIDVINPATETAIVSLALGNAKDVDAAVTAARRAFPAFSQTSVAERMALLQKISVLMKARFEVLADSMTAEMGAPYTFAREGQVASGIEHFDQIINVLGTYAFETHNGTTMVSKEAAGVCGLITPWNWPLNQIACKVAPALAAGCTMVLKPSEIAPLSAIVFAEIMHEAGVPKGVFNLVHGDGPTVGHALSIHPDVDVMSFTGSTRAGVLVARDAAETVKRVLQELGGNSANIVLDDADLETAVVNGMAGCYLNAGQSCDSPARMLVPHKMMNSAIEIARRAAQDYRTGDPRKPKTILGPLVSEAHFNKVQNFIRIGIEEGAELVAGGLGRPDSISSGYFTKATVFGRVKPEMTIARNEIFGPVLSLIGYDTDEEALKIANDTEYGLAGYVQSGNIERARLIARQLRVGTVQINYPPADYLAPFGGYKRSGNGREYGAYGLHDYLEIKSTVGFGKAEKI